MIRYQFDDEELRTIAIEVELTVKTKKRHKDILSNYFNPYNSGNKYDLVIYVVPTGIMKSRLERIFDNLPSQGKFFVMTIERFKHRFTRTDLDYHLEAIERRRTRDKLAEQKRDEENSGRNWNVNGELNRTGLRRRNASRNVLKGNDKRKLNGKDNSRNRYQKRA